MPQERRAMSDNLIKWLTIIGGVLALMGAVVGMAVSYGSHMRADDDQDRRLSALEERVRVLDVIAVSEHPRYSPTIYPKGTP
jgi:hypothetical protein